MMKINANSLANVNTSCTIVVHCTFQQFTKVKNTETYANNRLVLITNASVLNRSR